MFLKVPYLFFKSLHILRTDKKIMLFSLVPVLIGFISYYFLGNWVFGDLRILGEEYISAHIEVTGITKDIFLGLLIILFAVAMNWTFFIFVSIIASPFNDIISSRVQMTYMGREESFESSFSDMFKKLPSTLKNEFKKILFVCSLSAINILIGFTFPPASFLIAGLILAITFVDYSWSRNDFSFSECFTDLKKGFLSYLLGGICFMFLISIPIVNLFFLPLAIIFFTVIFCEIRNKNE